MRAVKAIGSVLLTGILIVALLVLGIAKPVSELLSSEKMSKTISKGIDSVVALVFEEDVDENSEIGQIKKEVKEMIVEAGYSEKILELAKNDGVKEAVGEFLSSAILAAADPSVEVVYPEKEKLVDAAYEMRDELQEMFNLKVDPSNMTKEELDGILTKNYDGIIKEMEKFADSLKGGTE